MRRGSCARRHAGRRSRPAPRRGGTAPRSIAARPDRSRGRPSNSSRRAGAVARLGRGHRRVEIGLLGDRELAARRGRRGRRAAARGSGRRQPAAQRLGRAEQARVAALELGQPELEVARTVRRFRRRSGSRSLVSTSTRLVSRRSSASSWSSRVSAVAGAVGRPLPPPVATSAARSSPDLPVQHAEVGPQRRRGFGCASCAAAAPASAAARQQRRPGSPPTHSTPSAQTPGPAHDGHRAAVLRPAALVRRRSRPAAPGRRCWSRAARPGRRG